MAIGTIPPQPPSRGVLVFVAGAVSYTMDLGAPEHQTVGVDGAQSFSLLHVHPETVTTSVVPDEQGRSDFWSRTSKQDG
ncbi:hypothetical protein [Rathayibacter toxicus]|uniref:Uncharacterized protein n=1 Tax=Rathayibacter toxicus TaxID=145458 RepID=A0A2S5Y6Z2_9MICO|nr:hypothetical protein [Rathayibacter toxicus]ALS56507.1 hypothetical protein APU90_00805 [Rathayibacter toxicus]PPG21668.1 hypothetical protein C5D15_05465 [Rathayibacter toxicus]PPG46630.1 hypothetical protein C5D16_05440 [Rathayibacter toxicus]PPH23712.1 hypothetical protein C5D17_05470 [Rathayibacter toxicus]PPH57518.1 hypothetical protein C5D30_05490 [Rathayibacter toxicus]